MFWTTNCFAKKKIEKKKRVDYDDQRTIQVNQPTSQQYTLHIYIYRYTSSPLFETTIHFIYRHNRTCLYDGRSSFRLYLLPVWNIYLFFRYHSFIWNLIFIGLCGTCVCVCVRRRPFITAIISIRFLENRRKKKNEHSIKVREINWHRSTSVNFDEI